MVSRWIENQAGWSVRKPVKTAQPLPHRPDPGPVTHCRPGCRVRRRRPANVNDVPRYVALGDGRQREAAQVRLGMDAGMTSAQRLAGGTEVGLCRAERGGGRFRRGASGLTTGELLCASVTRLLSASRAFSCRGFLTSGFASERRGMCALAGTTGS